VKHVHRFEEGIDRRKIEDLLKSLRHPNSPRCVYVNSPGGAFEFFSELGPAIERLGITTLSGNVRSAAVILFLLGHRRVADLSSTFFFHEVRTLVGDGGVITITDLESVREYDRQMSGKKREVYQEWLRRMELAQRWFVQFIQGRTGVPASTFLNLMRSEATISPHEALRYGIVHEIVSAYER